MGPLYDEHAYVEVDPRVDLAGEPGYAFWEARHFDMNPRHKLFLTEAACYGIQSGLVLGLCTRDPAFLRNDGPKLCGRDA